MVDAPADPSPGVTFSKLRPGRCPYCGTGRPQIALLNDFQKRGNRRWATFTATCCDGILLVMGREGVIHPDPPIERVYPEVRTAAVEIPERARTYLQQAFETLQKPDAAVMVAGSAVDAMLQHLGLVDGSVYSRIDQAVKQHTLTAAMGDWAHEVRLGSNRPRHADKDNPHVSPGEARQSVEFAEMLGLFLFVLSSRVKRGIAEAKGEAGAVGSAAGEGQGIRVSPLASPAADNT